MFWYVKTYLVPRTSGLILVIQKAELVLQASKGILSKQCIRLWGGRMNQPLRTMTRLVVFLLLGSNRISVLYILSLNLLILEAFKEDAGKHLLKIPPPYLKWSSNSGAGNFTNRRLSLETQPCSVGCPSPAVAWLFLLCVSWLISTPCPPKSSLPWKTQQGTV